MESSSTFLFFRALTFAKRFVIMPFNMLPKSMFILKSLSQVSARSFDSDVGLGVDNRITQGKPGASICSCVEVRPRR